METKSASEIIYFFPIEQKAMELGPYSPTILKTILCLFLQDCTYETNATSNWLNRKN